jgi:phospholipid transport system substrate-binding protein
MVSKGLKWAWLPVVLLMTAFSGFAKADEPQSMDNSTPSQFVQKLGDVALSSLTDKTMSRAVREQHVREILESSFDIAAIGRFAMGTYWRDASETQRSEYLGLFENSLVTTYTNRFEDYSGQTLKVNGFIASGDTDSIVSSQVVQKDGPSVNVEWRVRKVGSNFKIVDVVVEGISMSITQRSDFTSVIQRSGNSIDSLLASLREQNKPQKT